MSKKLKYLKNMKPTRMWIDGTSYNIKLPKAISTKDEVSEEQHKLFNITTDDGGKSKTSFRLPSIYYKKLYENHNFNLESFQTKTNTELTIPATLGNVSIIGNTYENVANAREEMHLLISEIRKRSPAMQFISIPTLSEDIKNKFQLFKQEILNSGVYINGLEESVFQKAEKLHLTVAVFSLMDDVEKDEAIKALHTCKTDVIDKFIKNGSLKINLKGIDCMEGNIKYVNVLYAKGEFENPTDNCNLQKMANEIADYFQEKGLLKEYRDNVKIHFTLINTKYRKTNNPKKWQKKKPIDATYIYEKYKDFDFGTCNLDAIHLSLMGSVGEDGFYKPLTIVKL